MLWWCCMVQHTSPDGSAAYLVVPHLAWLFSTGMAILNRQAIGHASSTSYHN